MEKEKGITRLEKIISEDTNLAPDKIGSRISSVVSVLQSCNYDKDNSYIVQFRTMISDLRLIPGVWARGNYQTNEELKYAFLNLVNKIIEDINIIGLPEPKKEKTPAVINNHMSQTQNQSQTQEIAITIFLESIKDELTGRQIKEIKEIVEQEEDVNQAKPKIIEKLKSYGGDILSNIIANIITNPTILASF